MTEVFSSVAISLDGYIDDNSENRLILSSKEDMDDVYLERSFCDAILVGAGTLRSDNPSLIIKDEELIRQRLIRGQSQDLIKVTITNNGLTDSSLRFFQIGSGRKIVYCSERSFDETREALAGIADVINIGSTITAASVLASLDEQGIKSVFVEGGTKIHTMFFQEDKVQKLRVAIAPFFVGDNGAPRFVNPSAFPFNKNRRMKVISSKLMGDTVVTTYDLTK